MSRQPRKTKPAEDWRPRAFTQSGRARPEWRCAICGCEPTVRAEFPTYWYLVLRGPEGPHDRACSRECETKLQLLAMWRTKLRRVFHRRYLNWPPGARGSSGP